MAPDKPSVCSCTARHRSRLPLHYYARDWRRNAILTVGTQLGFRDYHTTPDSLLQLLPAYTRTPDLSVGVCVGQLDECTYPELSISAENGISFAGIVQQACNQEGGGKWRVTICCRILDLYRALDLPGYRTMCSPGGLREGGKAKTLHRHSRLVPQRSGAGDCAGMTIGDSPRDFGVRGYGRVRARDASVGKLVGVPTASVEDRARHQTLPALLRSHLLHAVRRCRRSLVPRKWWQRSRRLFGADAQRRLMSRWVATQS